VTGAEENCIMRMLSFLLFLQIKEDEMSLEYSPDGRDEKCLHNFSQKISDLVVDGRIIV
jgi:hypothetical protein